MFSPGAVGKEPGVPPSGRTPLRPGETEDQRLDRNLLELLNEVRVAMPGVQVLFGFLLAVPFQGGFQAASSFQRHLLLACLLCAATATALLVAPVAYHRIMFRRGARLRLVETGNASLLGGLALLALAMIGAVMLVTDFLFGTTTTVVVAACGVLLYGGLWFGLGTARRLQDGRAAA
jgi:hypothetical protein